VRIGIFGGTFDPPHTGHLIVASDAAEALELDQLWFIPNARQPLKGDGAASAADRLEMVRLLAGSDPRFGVDSVEIDRAGPSYTVETLAVFASRYPDARRYLLIGADAAATFAEWREPRRILALAELAILQRDGGRGDPSERDAVGRNDLLAGARWLPTRRIDISSTEIRERIRDGKSIRGFVPDAVAEYIAAAGLYR
jgi:nicotinate-nucleotide adenylyltransferase